MLVLNVNAALLVKVGRKVKGFNDVAENVGGSEGLVWLVSRVHNLVAPSDEIIKSVVGAVKRASRA